MMPLNFLPIPTETVAAYRAGAPDANGQLPERVVAQSDGGQCRHCLQFIKKGAPMLVLAHRPFSALQPYAECGPVFLCAEACVAYDAADIPNIFAEDAMMVRGYGADERIVYGTGQIAASGQLAAACDAVLSRPDVAFVHIRSSRNNCYQARVERAD